MKMAVQTIIYPSPELQAADPKADIKTCNFGVGGKNGTAKWRWLFSGSSPLPWTAGSHSKICKLGGGDTLNKTTSNGYILSVYK